MGTVISYKMVFVLPHAPTCPEGGTARHQKSDQHNHTPIIVLFREARTYCLATHSESLHAFAHARDGVIFTKIGGREELCLYFTEPGLTKNPEMRSYDSLPGTPFQCKIIQKW
ncbi:hypothetical protein AVEN_80458-1 [Araneus ventricosus]|uniref:Uncharacterized protein n=1 Tax=Araneus ventricosus TaxID=182803 RepID=A0A4Y2HA78_ARAVE|nr:hypothetical protein AVEN_80458-1 [Araneus ventricosus]